MKLVKPSFEITSIINGEEILANIEKAARTCYKSEEKIEIGEKSSNGELINLKAISARPLLQKLIDLGHDAMLEFGGMITVKFVCDRGVSHELVRHRLVSFAQESTRYCNYGKQEHLQFIIPEWLIIPEKEYDIAWANKYGDCDIDPTVEHTPASRWFWNMAIAERDYTRLLKEGWTPQQARTVLPNSLKTEINMSANTREWRHIFKQRVSKAAHPQMRELMIPLLEEFKKRIPLLYDDINP